MVASEPTLSHIGWMVDSDGRRVRFRADPGTVEIRCAPPVKLDTPERRENFARLYMEACRRADGEPPAAEAGQLDDGSSVTAVNATRARRFADVPGQPATEAP